MRKEKLQKRRTSTELQVAWTGLDFSAAEGILAQKLALMVHSLVLRRRRPLSVWEREPCRLPSGR